MKSLTPQVLQLCTGASDFNAAQHCDPIQDSLDRFKIVTVPQVAAFLATISVETGCLSKLEESLYYRDAGRLARIYPRKFKTAEQALPYTRNHAALSKLLYDGYHGRGYIQLTWLSNYQLAGQALGFDYVAHPEWVCQPKHAALTAGWYWATNKINDVAEDIRAVTLRVNGVKLMHLKERTEQYQKNLLVLA